MKLRNVVALALVGWNLMLPFYGIKGVPISTDSNTPLTQWSIWKSFDSASECEAARDEIRKREKKESQNFKINLRCVSSDDPRLKPK
jgi:hypothetical protein